MSQDLFGQGQYIPKNHSVYRLIKDYEKTYKDVFEKIKIDWNKSIREYLRNSTGLRLSQNKKIKTTERDVSISVEIMPDCEDEFVRLVDEHYPNLDFNEYAQLREFQAALQKSMSYFNGDNKPSEEADILLNYCEKYFKEYDLNKIIDQLFKVRKRSTDVLGTYTYQYHNVELYYLPIIVFSKLKSLDPEYMLITVLAHELSHAYHHCGWDQDNMHWKSMPGTDLEIIEGLAQYYTDRFVKENEIQYPQLKKAYDVLTSCQSGPYIVHKGWLKVYTEEHIKLALYRARRTEITEYRAFKKVLAESKRALNKTK